MRSRLYSLEQVQVGIDRVLAAYRESQGTDVEPEFKERVVRMLPVVYNCESCGRFYHPDDEKFVPVEFEGQRLWIQEPVLRGEANGGLAPEHHVENGELSFPACFDGDSFAHVFAGTIVRYGRVIGTVADLRRAQQ